MFRDWLKKTKLGGTSPVPDRAEILVLCAFVHCLGAKTRRFLPPQMGVGLVFGIKTDLTMRFGVLKHQACVFGYELSGFDGEHRVSIIKAGWCYIETRYFCSALANLVDEHVFLFELNFVSRKVIIVCTNKCVPVAIEGKHDVQ